MEKLGKLSPLQDPQLLTSLGWKLKRSVLLSQWEAQDRKLRLGRGQLIWESVAGTSGPLKKKESDLCWSLLVTEQGLTRNTKESLSTRSQT